MNFRPELVDLILAGRKTQTRRPVKGSKPCPYRVGGSYAVQPGRGKPGVARLVVTCVHCERLDAISEDDARREGFADRACFLRYVAGLYASKDVWSDEFWVISFVLMVAEQEG